MKKLLFIIKILLSILFLLALFASIILTNNEILKYIIRINSLIFLIFLIYTLYKKDIFLYKSAENSINNLIVASKNKRKNLILNNNSKKLFSLIKRDKDLRKIFFKFLNIRFLNFFLNIFLIAYEISIINFYDNLNNNIFLLKKFIILIPVVILIILIKIIIVLYNTLFNSKIINKNKTNNNLEKLKISILKISNKTYKVDILIYILSILETIIIFFLI